MHSHSEWAVFQAISGGADGHMSMHPWVGYAGMGRQAWAWRPSWVMGMACVLWVAGYGRGVRGAWVPVGVVGVPWLWQGKGASGVPIQRNLLNVYPNLEL